MTFFQGGTIGQFQYEFTSAVLVPKTRAAGFAYLVTQWNLLNINIYIKRYFVSFRTTTVEGYKAVSPFLADPTNRIRTEVWIQKQIDWINITPSMIMILRSPTHVLNPEKLSTEEDTYTIWIDWRNSKRHDVTIMINSEPKDAASRVVHRN